MKVADSVIPDLYAAMYDVLECDPEPSDLGEVRRLRIHRLDMAPMGFRELWGVFAAHYPGRYAAQIFPPEHELIDQANKYHLWLLPRKPAGLTLI